MAKTYLALVDGAPSAASGVVELPLAVRGGRAHPDPRGRPARTAWSVAARHGATTLLTVQPTTGRLHQIRAHLAPSATRSSTTASTAARRRRA